MSTTPTPTETAPAPPVAPVVTTPVITPQATTPTPTPARRLCEICKKTFIPDEDDLHICHDCQKKSKGKRFWILYMAELTVALIVIVPLWSDVIVKALESTNLLQGEAGFTIKVTVQALLGTMILVLRKVYTTPANTAEAAMMQNTAATAAKTPAAPASALSQQLQASTAALTQQATAIQSAAANALTTTTQAATQVATQVTNAVPTTVQVTLQ